MIWLNFTGELFGFYVSYEVRQCSNEHGMKKHTENIFIAANIILIQNKRFGHSGERPGFVHQGNCELQEVNNFCEKGVLE